MAFKLSSFPATAGAPYYPTGAGVRARRLDATGTAPDMTAAGIITTASAPARMGTSTGRVLVNLVKGERHWIELTTPAGVGFVRQDLITALRKVSEIASGEGRDLITNLMLRGNATARELLYQAELIRRRGGAVPDALKTQHAALRARHIAIRRKLAADGRIKYDTKPLPGFEKLTNEAAVSGAAVGFAPLVIWGAIALGTLAIVGVTWYVLYNAYHTDAKTAELDLSQCKQLTATLEQLQPAQAAAVKAEIQNQLDKGFQEGFTKAATEAEGGGVFGGAKDLLKWGAILFAATKFLA
jgi:hypothetical protein